MYFPERIETERLVLRWLREDDITGMKRFFSQKECYEFLSPGIVYQILVEKKMPIILSNWLVNYYLDDEMNTMLGVERKGTGEFVGFLGLEKRQIDEHPRIVYCILKEHWGRGYATEATKKLLGHIFAGAKCHRVEALVDPRNKPSIRVADKIGMRFEGMVHDLEFPDDQRLYGIEK